MLPEPADIRTLLTSITQSSSADYSRAKAYDALKLMDRKGIMPDQRSVTDQLIAAMTRKLATAREGIAGSLASIAYLLGGGLTSDLQTLANIKRKLEPALAAIDAPAGEGATTAGDAWAHDYCDHDADPADTAACEIDSAIAALSQHLDGATAGDPRLIEIATEVNLLRESWARLCVRTPPPEPASVQESEAVDMFPGVSACPCEPDHSHGSHRGKGCLCCGTAAPPPFTAGEARERARAEAMMAARCERDVAGDPGNDVLLVAATEHHRKAESWRRYAAMLDRNDVLERAAESALIFLDTFDFGSDQMWTVRNNLRPVLARAKEQQ